MKRFLLPLLPLVMAAPAFAGNLAPVVTEPTPVAPTTVAVAPVYSWSGAYVGAQASYADIDTSGDADLDGDGGLYGLRAGYDFQRGNQVFGGVLQYDVGSIGLDDSDVDVEDVLRVGGRYGFTTGPALYYGTAGYAQVGTDDLGDADGYFLGLGYERFVTDNVTLGAEALYHDFNGLDDADGVDSKAKTIGLNVNYRF